MWLLQILMSHFQSKYLVTSQITTSIIGMLEHGSGLMASNFWSNLEFCRIPIGISNLGISSRIEFYKDSVSWMKLTSGFAMSSKATTYFSGILNLTALKAPNAFLHLLIDLFTALLSYRILITSLIIGLQVQVQNSCSKGVFQLCLLMIFELFLFQMNLRVWYEKRNRMFTLKHGFDVV